MEMVEAHGVHVNRTASKRLAMRLHRRPLPTRRVRNSPANARFRGSVEAGDQNQTKHGQMLSSSMLPLNLILLIEVTFSTPTPVNNNNRERVRVFSAVRQIQRSRRRSSRTTKIIKTPVTTMDIPTQQVIPITRVNALLQQLPKLMWKGSHAVYACRPTIRAAQAEEPGRHWPFVVFCRSPVCSTASL
jgi:hypothetical protein